MLVPLLRRKTTGLFDALEVDTQSNKEYELAHNVSFTNALDTIQTTYKERLFYELHVQRSGNSSFCNAVKGSEYEKVMGKAKTSQR